MEDNTTEVKEPNVNDKRYASFMNQVRIYKQYKRDMKVHKWEAEKLDYLIRNTSLGNRTVEAYKEKKKTHEAMLKTFTGRFCAFEGMFIHTLCDLIKNPFDGFTLEAVGYTLDNLENLDISN